LVKKEDDNDRRFAPTEYKLNTPNGLRIKTTWRESGKNGEITVIDLESSKQRQQIASVAQRPLAVSADGKWLVMYAFNQETLRVYRIQK